MQIDDLGMPPFNTTLVGVLKGALDYYKFDVSAPMVFGATGHAFLINIHKQLCPSGPYCWKRTKAEPLIENLGLRMIDLGFYCPQNGSENRADVEKRLRDGLDKEIPCSLLNLENQMITGYDDTGFFTVQPWAAHVDSPPAKLSFGTWKEFGDEFHVNFYTIEKVEPCDRLTAILDSLDYAVELNENPSAHNQKDYGIGPEAYTNWINAVEEHGSSHGNWWNATVWSECRAMASKYFAEIGKRFRYVSRSVSQLEKAYAEIADALGTLSDKKMDPKKKVTLLEETRKREAAAIEMVTTFAALLRVGKNG